MMVRWKMMVRWTMWMVLPLAWGCASAAPAAESDGREAWRTDWRAFGEAIAPYGRAGVIEQAPGSDRGVNELNNRFSEEVEWTGTVRSVRSGAYGANVSLDMPPLEIPLRDGRSTTLRSLSISCHSRGGGECARWTSALVGRRVRFRTALENRTRGIQPVVRMEYGGYVEVATNGGDFVRVESR
jgi:hypothetical protein